VIGIDLIPQRRNAVLPEEDGPLDLLLSHLPLLHLKAKCLKLRVQDCQYCIAGQPLREGLTPNLHLR